MLDFDKLKSRFCQFGGWRLVWQYIRMGVLWTGVSALVRCALKGRSLKAAYPVITEKVDRILIRRYRYILDEMKARHVEDSTSNDTGVPKIVWFSWLQGIDQAPDLVKVYLASQRKHLPDYEFRVFDLSNYQQWIELPVGLSNWFIAAVPHQIVISSVLDMLFAYWKDYNCLVDYYVIHLFLGLSLRKFPMVEVRMPRENSYHSILLGDALGRTFQQEQWQDLIDHVSIHKLNSRKVEMASKNPMGYYWHVMKEFE